MKIASFSDKKKLIIGILFCLIGPVIITVSMVHANRFSPGLFVITVAVGVFVTAFAMHYPFEKGIEFDFEKNKYRFFKKIFFVNTGEWNSLAGFEKILFREFSYITRDTDDTDGFDTRGKGVDYQLYLAGKTKKNVKIYVFDDKQEAWNTANHLVDKLGFELKILNH